MIHPILYKRTSTGAIQEWCIDVVGATIITRYGQVGGKLQSTEDTIKVGKNIGKANETTPEEQAELEAKSQWEKKAKRGYVQNMDDASSGTVDSEFIAGGINPMLAQPYSKHGAKITYPSFVQPKLDGHRCVAILDANGWTLWSRTRKPITGVPHIIKALETSPIRFSVDPIILDGELYNHDYKDKFEELTSFIKRPEPKEGHEVVQYHVYDLVNDTPFNERTEALRTIANAVNSDSIIFVRTVEVHSFDEAQVKFASFLEDGYEGAMLRNHASPYVQKRSYDLQKLKEFDDAEFKIIGVEEGRGKMAGKGIFVCETSDGSAFRAKLKGNLDNLSVYLDDPDKWIGQILTVQYQGITNDSQVPRFPVGLRIREDV